jgi:hypothetical protein
MESDHEANHFCRLCQELFNESAPWQGLELSPDQSVQDAQLKGEIDIWTRYGRGLTSSDINDEPVKGNRGDLDISFDDAFLYPGLSSPSSTLFLTVAMFETVFGMGLLSGKRLQIPKLCVSGLMLLPTRVKNGQFEQ